jgi:ferredoxin-NADP reductase
MEKELSDMLGDNAVFILTQEKPQKEGILSGRINESFLKQHLTDFTKHFYVCGPDKMVGDINDTLEKLGASPETVVFEK